MKIEIMARESVDQLGPSEDKKRRILAVAVQVGDTMKGVDLDLDVLERLPEVDAINAIGRGLEVLAASLKMHRAWAA